jgi:hypothetical protein
MPPAIPAASFEQPGLYTADNGNDFSNPGYPAYIVTQVDQWGQPGQVGDHNLSDCDGRNMLMEKMATAPVQEAYGIQAPVSQMDFPAASIGQTDFQAASMGQMGFQDFGAQMGQPDFQPATMGQMDPNLGAFGAQQFAVSIPSPNTYNRRNILIVSQPMDPAQMCYLPTNMNMGQMDPNFGAVEAQQFGVSIPSPNTYNKRNILTVSQSMVPAEMGYLPTNMNMGTNNFVAPQQPLTAQVSEFGNLDPVLRYLGYPDGNLFGTEPDPAIYKY